MFFKLVFWFLLVLSGFLYSQDGFPGMVGSYDDLKLIPPQTRQLNGFSFARLVYNGLIPTYSKNWFTDYPEGDKTMIEIIKRLTKIDIAPEGRAISICSRDLFNYPFVYSAEGGQMVLDTSDALKLKEYLNRGGFWMIDDFWGTFEWNQFEREIKKIFPDREIVDIPTDHPIFHVFFDIDKVIQVPNVGYAYCSGCPTWEEDGYEPKVRGIFDEQGRLVILIFFNTDTMDALEWANDQNYPHHFSAYAYKIFVNSIIYAMTH